MAILSDKSGLFPPVRVVYNEEDIDAALKLIADAMRVGVLTQGPLVSRFEAAIAAVAGAAETVAVSSATSGLEIILRSIGVADREVIVPANTFAATAAAAVHAGARVRFTDIELDNYSLDPAELRKAISCDTGAVIVVHIGGIISNRINEITAICSEHGVPLIEDAAQALGSYYDSSSAGTFGLAGAFSFFPTKIVTTGEGGIIATGDEGVASAARVMRNYGKDGGEDCVILGHNWRMSDINAALGIVQLRRLKEFIATKRQIGEYYDEALAKIPGIRLTALAPQNKTNRYKYIALLDKSIDKACLRESLKTDYGICLSGDVFAKPCSSLSIFGASGHFKAAENFCESHICLPIYSDMTLAEAKYVTKSLAGAIDGFRKNKRGRGDTGYNLINDPFGSAI